MNTKLYSQIRTTVTLIFVSCFSLSFSYSQGNIPNKVSVRFGSSVNNPSQFSLATQPLESIYSEFEVYAAQQLYPEASLFNHPLASGLSRVYILTCNCDEESLLSELLQLDTSTIENAYLCYEDIPVSISPPPYIPNDPEDASWNMFRLENINAYDAWGITKGDPEIKIAICDAGFEIDHPDLENKIVYMHPEIVTDGDHGTLVAASAAEDTDNGIGHSAIGFNCSLMLMPAGTEYFLPAVMSGADVINYSYIGCIYDQNKNDLMQMITDLGVTIVAGSGNGTIGPMGHCGGTENNNYAYPASYPSVISVSGTGPNNCLEYTSSCWSPYGNTRHFTQNDAVDVLAAGMCVRGAVKHPDWDYDWGIGSSFASPIVAGLVGLMLSVDPCISPADIQEILKSTDQDVYDESVCSGNNEAIELLMPGAGLVDAYAAVQAAADIGTEYHINNGQTIIWDNEDIEAKDIYVHSGGTLIILNGSNVKIKKDKRIIVEREAILYVDNSVISSKCDKYSSRWGGIFVHGNASIEQPDINTDHPAQVLEYTFSQNESGIVVITNGSSIINAKVGISTSAPGYEYPEQVARWGGLVIIDHSNFSNCRTGISFMKYDFENKSKISYTNFTKDPAYEVANSGITIWSCFDIDIEQNYFEYMYNAGIAGFDYNGEITNSNTFKHCGRGLDIYSTSPHASGVKIKDNKFIENKEHIVALGINMANGLEINHNEFLSASSHSIWIDGPSYYRILNNIFNDNGLFDIINVNTSDKFSTINFNQFNSGIYGIVYVDDNRQSRFLNNCYSKSENDIVLTTIQPSGHAIINPFIGTPIIPAGNCFSILNEQIHAPTSEASFFRYYIPPSPDSEIDDCNGNYNPSVNLNNYSVIPSISEVSALCSDYIDPPIPFVEYDFQDLNDARSNKLTIFNNLSQNPTDTTLMLEYEEVLNLVSDIEGFLETTSISVLDFDQAEEIYSTQADAESLKALYGLKFRRGDYPGADSVLNIIPRSTADDYLFVDIQEINLERMTTNNYELSSTDRDFLYNSALSNSAVRGYAASLYTLLTGESIYFEFPSLFDERSAPFTSTYNSLPPITLFPNPAVDIISIQLNDKVSYSGTAILLDLTGRIVGAHPINSDNTLSYEISVSDLYPGIYFVKLPVTETKSGATSEYVKFIIQR